MSEARFTPSLSWWSFVVKWHKMIGVSVCRGCASSVQDQAGIVLFDSECCIRLVGECSCELHICDTVLPGDAKNITETTDQ